MFSTIARMTAVAGLVFAMSAAPAMAICRYGTPHCINKNPGPKAPTVNTNTLPDSGWEDPDCAAYGNCLDDDWMAGGKITMTPPK